MPPALLLLLLLLLPLPLRVFPLGLLSLLLGLLPCLSVLSKSASLSPCLALCRALAVIVPIVFEPRVVKVWVVSMMWHPLLGVLPFFRLSFLRAQQREF
jgi:hypothetical protein